MSAPQELPEQFGRYRILKKLGQGGMGSVFLAEDTQLGCLVALKVPTFRDRDDPRSVERFRREAKLAQSIHHPCICPVYEEGEVDGTRYLTMAFIEGTPLSELVAPGEAWPQERAAELVRRLALALDALHQRGVIHRDLKPHNIMVRADDVPMLMDFGLARGLGDEQLTTAGTPLGTPAYMPPEQIKGLAEDMGPTADVYSLGVLLYQLLTGELPFEAENVWALFHQVQNAPAPPPSARRPDLDRELEEVCLKAMAKKSEERFASASAFAAALVPYARQASVATAPPAGPFGSTLALPAPRRHETTLRTAQETARAPRPGPEPPTPPDRPASRLALWLALVLLLAAGVTGWFVLRDEDKNDPSPPDKTARNGGGPKDGPAPRDRVARDGEKEKGGPPAVVPSLRLLPLGPVTLEAGKSQVVRVRVQRADCPGPVQVRLAEASPGVTVHDGQVGEGGDEGGLELRVAAGAAEGERTLRLEAIAAAARDEGRLRLTIRKAPAPPSLRLLALGAVSLWRGESQKVPVRIERTNCPGRVTVRLAKPPPGVTAREGQVDDGSDAGSLELKAGEGAAPGEWALRVEITANGVSDGGELRLTIPAAGLARFRNKVGMEMVLIPKDTFGMGSPPGEGADNEKEHDVEVTRPFYMGAFEVTQEQYLKVMGSNPADFRKQNRGGPDLPVEMVYWYDAVQFCNRLSGQHGLPPYYRIEGRKVAALGGKGYRLPTEAEWEYACRGGAKPYAVFHFGNALSFADANFDSSSPYGGGKEGPREWKTRPVGSYKPNGFGLFDMHGNVWEWCQDWYDGGYYKNGPKKDPQGPESGKDRVLRGGSWYDFGRDCRSANRYKIAPEVRGNHIGFRVVCAADSRAP